MTYEDFIAQIKDNSLIASATTQEYQRLTEEYPFFTLGHWLYLKSLHLSNNLYFKTELKKTALLSPNRRNLFYFINIDQREELTPTNYHKHTSETGGYFDMIEHLDNQDKNSKKSLQKLAEKLKKARQQDNIQTPIIEEKKEAPLKEKESVEKERITSAKKRENRQKEQILFVQELIKTKKYDEALRILKAINLNNTKKSVYFADQILFLETIVNKKS